MYRWPKASDVINMQQMVDRLVNESLFGWPLRAMRAVGELGKVEARLQLPLDV